MAEQKNITDPFNSIAISMPVANIKITTSNAEICMVKYHEKFKQAFAPIVIDNTLIVKDNRKWYHHILPNPTTPQIDIILPTTQYENLRIKCKSGNIELESINCKDVILNTKTGKILLNDINCHSVESKGSTGSISLKNVISKEKIKIIRNTGSIFFEDCEAFDIFTKTNTGNINGTLLSSKTFIVKSKSGKIDIPENAEPRCEAISNTGKISFKIK